MNDPELVRELGKNEYEEEINYRFDSLHKF